MIKDEKKKSKIQSVQVSASAVAILDEQLTKELMPDKKKTHGGGIVLLLVTIICQVCNQIACQLFNILYSF
jgi:hypothetical protein